MRELIIGILIGLFIGVASILLWATLIGWKDIINYYGCQGELSHNHDWRGMGDGVRRDR